MVPVQVLIQENTRSFSMGVPGIPGLIAQGDTYEACLATLRQRVREKLLSAPLDTTSLVGRLIVVSLEPVNAAE